MAITIGTDSYISIAEADAYMDANYITTSAEFIAWDALTDANKEILLKKATKKIDRQRLRGVKALSSQTLQFPRALRTNDLGRTYTYNVIDKYWSIETEVDQRVKDAQIEESIGQLTKSSSANKRAELQAQGVKRFRLGDLSEDYGDGFNSTNNATILLSQEAKELLSYYITNSVRTI